MSDLAVRVSGLGKQYRIGQSRGGYDLLSEAIGRRVRRFGRRVATPADFWALSDIDFEVDRGETFGIIGRNGAGKSTLLKMLSRITRAHARAASVSAGGWARLLEVGTGFHPELTGRENIFLNGAILGMTRAARSTASSTRSWRSPRSSSSSTPR